MKTIFLSVPVVAAALLSGCVAFQDKYHVEIRDKDRIPIKFESSKARDIFCQKVAKKSTKGFESKSEGFILGLAYGKNVTFYETDFYNLQIRMADIDGNGTITDKEAESF